MPAHFDRAAEDEKLARIRSEEMEDLAQIAATRLGLPYADLSMTPINMDALRLVPEPEARAAQAVVYDKNGKHLQFAVRDPEAPEFTRLLERFTADGFLPELALASAPSLEIAFARYRDLSKAHASEEGVFGVPAERLSILTSLGSIEAFRDHLASLLETVPPPSPTIALEEIIGGALALRASDIHLEPEEDRVHLRLRLNGILTDAGSLSLRAYRLIDSRIKILSGLKLNVSDRPQDGRFTAQVGDSAIEIRTSIIPSSGGESIVLRVLDPEATQHGFVSMGLEPKLLARLAEEIRRPNGMLLTTGPTGSGKTTTLYAFLREVHTPGVKIVTLEDPIEYRLPGVTQTQIHEGERDTSDHGVMQGGTQQDTGYTFASGLRSILRQDPEIIMVGEIRDEDVAKTAIEAAQTGHFVFSTLHTNSAAGTFPRLVDLGIDPKELASAVTVAMAQRLVRTLDPEKKTARQVTDEERTIIERVLVDLPAGYTRPTAVDQVWSPDPTYPEDAAYHGRTGVFEAIFMDDELGAFLRDNPSERDIAKHVRRQGFLSIAQDAILKVLAGVTSFEEVARVVDLPR